MNKNLEDKIEYVHVNVFMIMHTLNYNMLGYKFIFIIYFTCLRFPGIEMLSIGCSSQQIKLQANLPYFWDCCDIFVSFTNMQARDPCQAQCKPCESTSQGVSLLKICKAK